MRIKRTFQNKKVTIHLLSKNDLNKVEKFVDYINSLVKEKAQIMHHSSFALAEEKKWLKEQLRDIKNKKEVMLVAEADNKIIGIVDIKLGKGRQNHIGDFGISIRQGYRRLGLGKYLTKQIIQLARKRLKPRFIRISVFSTNKIAQKLYRKFGFKVINRIPHQFQYRGRLVDEIIMMKSIRPKKRKKYLK
ncbi:MAG: GNAT family N-acetyltransferase [Minisyncoccales bacterium]